MMEKLIEEILRLSSEVREYKGPPGVVYKIVDPTDQSVRYVGQTTQDIETRLNGHLSRPVSVSMRAWQEDLKARGWEPVIEVLEYASRATLLDRERYWIDNLWAGGEGEPLFNKGCAKFEVTVPEPEPTLTDEPGQPRPTRTQAGKEIYRLLQKGPATKSELKANIDGLTDVTAKDALKWLKVRGVAEYDSVHEVWRAI